MVKGPLGEDDFIKPLSILLSDHKKKSKLNASGQFLMQQLILSQLKNRSKLYQFVNSRNLSKVSGPVIVSGLPRSGTTFLFDLLQCDTNFRAPLTWEIFEMMPIANSISIKLLKILKTKLKLRLIKTLMPNLMNMHPMDASLPEECQQIMSIDFKSIFWAYSANVPEYEALLKTCDYSSSILWHSRFLQALETVDKPKNWLLKDPCHIQHIPEILKIYPDAKFIFIHRDPLEAIPSISSLTTHLRTPFTKNINKVEIGQKALSFWKNAIDCFMLDRNLIPKEQVIDIGFNNLITDPLKNISSIYKAFGLYLNIENQETMQQYLNKQKIISKHEYSYDEFGLDAHVIKASFKKYIGMYCSNR